MIKMCTEKSNVAIESEAERFAAQGLRTLVFGYKRIDGPPSAKVNSSYTGLPNLPTEAQEGEHNSEWDGVLAADVECDLTLVAVTAVEDLLQERVRESIQDFKDAGMKVWMLTGDKGATARMIGI